MGVWEEIFGLRNQLKFKNVGSERKLISS